MGRGARVISVNSQPTLYPRQYTISYNTDARFDCGRLSLADGMKTVAHHGGGNVLLHLRSETAAQFTYLPQDVQFLNDPHSPPSIAGGWIG